MKVLTALQEEFLKIFSATELKNIFYLTGGTALSAFYLQHRISEDMDFFTDEERDVLRALPIINEIASKIKGEIEIKKSFISYIEFFITRGDEIVRCDFALDSPYRLGEKVLNKKYDIYIDNLIDISCNKLSALYDRGEPKDFVDVFFIDREVISFEKLIEKAKKKHVVLENYWLSVSLAKVENIGILPRMRKEITIEELKNFFREKAIWLMKG